MTVLITGSSGRIGTSLVQLLPGLGWQLRGFDREPGDHGIEQLVGEVTDPQALDEAMAGVQAVVHLAGQPTEAPWPVIRTSNIEGTFEVFEAARRAGVSRLIHASSNHAVGFTQRAKGELLADTPPRPDTLYGVSKAFGEALGRYYHDRYGMRVACLRIGTFAERPPDQRAQATWLSPPDCARLVDACLRSEQLGYALIWGVSANRDRWWSLAAGAEVGYHPLDDAADFASDSPQRRPRPEYPKPEYVGGSFTDASFGIDEQAAGGTR